MEILQAVGASLAFLLPGIIAARLLFRRDGPLWVFSIGILLSFMITGFWALILSVLNFEISILTISGFNLGFALLAAIFLSRIKPEKETHPGQNSTILADVLIPLLSVGIFIAVVVIIFPIAREANKQGFSEFFITDGFGEDGPWTNQYNKEQLIEVRYVIVSHEVGRKTFSVILRSNEEILSQIGIGELLPGQSIGGVIEIPPRNGDPQKYELVLIDDDNKIEYRKLFFWIHGNENHDESSPGN